MGMTPLPDVVPTCGHAPTTRNARTARVALAAAAVLGPCMLLVACGSVAAPAGGGAGSSSAGSPAVSTSADTTPAAAANSAVQTSPGTAATAKVSLDVTFAATPSSPARHYTLFCEPAGGTTPDAAVACTKLLTGENIFAPRPRHVMCPMALAGSGRATITGTYFGKQEHVTIINGGCDLARWVELKAIFG
jgi:Subtilisin inhibitor-like